MSSERVGKYACLEIERRFLLKKLPVGLQEQKAWRITDHYLLDTRMRLRRLTSSKGNIAVYKFTQKFRSEGQSPAFTKITNLYLRAGEYVRLRHLGGTRLEKVRYRYAFEGDHYSIDVFDGSLTGLILAEIEFKTEAQMLSFRKPSFALAEVTLDDFYEGGSLIYVGERELQEKLKAY